MAASTGIEVAEIVRRFGESFLAAYGASMRREHRRVLGAIEACRTAALGGHLYRCPRCAYETPIYNSCRNRHCPKCQALASARWVEARQAELLPVPYFHLVFTVPEALRPLFRRHPRRLYGLLFRTVADSLLEVAADPRHLGARIGFLAILHTWTQTLLYHPHLHVVVPGGGLTADRVRWVGCRPGYFLPVRVLSRLFRGKLLAGLKELHARGDLDNPGPLEPPPLDPGRFAELLAPLYESEWVVYAKPPFGGPRRVLAYLARYTHRVAISNHRLLRLEGEQVVFTWRDRAHGDRQRTMRLHAHEFLRRFLLHALPDGFVRIRSYGLLANRDRQHNLERCRQALGAEPPEPVPSQDAGWAELLARLTGADPTRCPQCGKALLLVVGELAARGRAPPSIGSPS